jgi:selenocysteine-specific elongation factor
VVPLEGAELRPGEEDLAQLRLEAPLVPAPGDRLVLRRVAPPDTVGGGRVIDPSPRKHGAGRETAARLRALERGEAVEAAAPAPTPAPAPGGEEEPALDDAALRLAALLRSDGRSPRTDTELAEALGLGAGETAARLSRLERAGQAVRVGRNLHFSPEPLEEMTAQVLAMCARDGSASIAGVRDELATSRKYAQALLEHLDAARITLRRGDSHVLRRSRRAG